MLSRSAGGPLLAGLGTAAVLAVATAPPVLAEPDPAPEGGRLTSAAATEAPSEPPSDPPSDEPSGDPGDPSDPPTEDPTDPPSEDPTDPPSEDPTDPPGGDPTDPPTGDPTDPPTGDPSNPPTTPPPGGGDPGTGQPGKPVLSLWLSTSSSTVKPGGSVTVTVKVTSAQATAHGTVLRLAASGASVRPAAQGLGSIGGAGGQAQATLTAPADARPGLIKLKASVSASKAATVTRSYTLILTSASGALPPGVSLSNLPPNVPPLTDTAFDAVAGIPLPQVALPPVASPQIAASPPPLVPRAVLRARVDGTFGTDDLTAVHAGWLAAMTASVGLLLTRSRLARRGRLPAHVRRWLDGRRLTEARLRTVPPQPAPAPARLVWLPLRPKGAVRLPARG